MPRGPAGPVLRGTPEQRHEQSGRIATSIPLDGGPHFLNLGADLRTYCLSIE